MTSSPTPLSAPAAGSAPGPGTGLSARPGQGAGRAAVADGVRPAPSRIYRHTVGRHQIYRGDCLRVLGRLAPASVDVVITSPPYNLGLRYGIYNDRRGEAEYLDWFMTIAEAIKRVLRPDGSFFLNLTGSSKRPWLPFELMVRLRGMFHLQNHITWVKSISVGDDSVGHFKPVRSERFLHHNHEHLFHLTHDGTVRLQRLAVGVPFKDKSNIARRRHEHDLRCRGDTWFIPYSTVQARAEKFNHPAAFPVMLPSMCLRLHGKPDALVLDPFLGSGSSLVAAEAEGMRGIGIEIDATYVAAARRRLRDSLCPGTPVAAPSQPPAQSPAQSPADPPGERAGEMAAGACAALPPGPGADQPAPVAGPMPAPPTPAPPTLAPPAPALAQEPAPLPGAALVPGPAPGRAPAPAPLLVPGLAASGAR